MKKLIKGLLLANLSLVFVGCQNNNSTTETSESELKTRLWDKDGNEIPMLGPDETISGNFGLNSEETTEK